MSSFAFAPGFMQRIAQPNNQTVLVVGCGGGFDFCHGLLLYPLLKELGKKVVVGSYSFGDPELIQGADPVWKPGPDPKTGYMRPAVVRATAACRGSSFYCPETSMCAYVPACVVCVCVCVCVCAVLCAVVGIRRGGADGGGGWPGLL